MIDNNSVREDNVSTREFIDAILEKQCWKYTIRPDARQINQINSEIVWKRWELELKDQDVIWHRMFENNPQINLFPLCLEFFQLVKQNMDDDIQFHLWLACQKRKYPHRLAYQNIEL